jgi:hypothetical protein
LINLFIALALNCCCLCTVQEDCIERICQSINIKGKEKHSLFSEEAEDSLLGGGLGLAARLR